MITRENANDVLQRVGLVAMMYYPEVQVDDPDYRLSDDVTWCLEPLGAVPDAARASLTELVGLAVVDPTTNRSALFAAVMNLAPDTE